MRQNDPNIRAAKIARTLGISREYVRQILVTSNLPTTILPKPNGCLLCGVKVTKKSKTCMGCYHSLHQGYVICTTCNTPILRKKSYIKRSTISPRYTGKSFCNKECYNFYLKYIKMYSPNLGEKVRWNPRYILKKHLLHTGGVLINITYYKTLSHSHRRYIILCNCGETLTLRGGTFFT